METIIKFTAILIIIQAISLVPAHAAQGSCSYEYTVPTGFTLAWSDEFTNSTELTTKWDVWSGGAFNNELQCYKQANLVYTATGLLNITAKAQTVTCTKLPWGWDNSTASYSFTSGRIESKASFGADATTPRVRLVARMKLPSGAYNWPAFWLYGDPWPTQSEIDILEAKGQDPYSFTTNVFYGDVAGTAWSDSSTTSTVTSVTSTQSCFHTYEVLWEQNKLTYYYDGEQVAQKTGVAGTVVGEIWGKKGNVILNNAIGGGYFGGTAVNKRKVVPGTLQVDWVRVYTSSTAS